MSHIGRMLKTIRAASGLTQEQLAAKSGVPASIISRIETGRYNPNRKEIAQLQRALGVSFDSVRPSYDAFTDSLNNN